MVFSSVKQQRRWQKKFILLQQQLFQDEYSVISRFPRRKDSAIGAVVARKASQPTEGKEHTHFTDVDRPEIGRYVAKNGNTAATIAKI